MKASNIINFISLLCIIDTNICKCANDLLNDNDVLNPLYCTNRRLSWDKNHLTNSNEFLNISKTNRNNREVKYANFIKTNFIKTFDNRNTNNKIIIKDNANATGNLPQFTERNKRLQQLILFLDKKISTLNESMNNLNSDFNVTRAIKNYKNSEKLSQTNLNTNMKYNPLLLYGIQNTSLDTVHIEGIKTIYKIIKHMKENMPNRRVKRLQKIENICNCFLKKEQYGKIDFADIDINVSDLVQFKIEVSNMYNCGCISMPYHDGIQNICNKLIDYIEENLIIKCPREQFNNIRNFYCELCDKNTQVNEHIQLTKLKIKKFNDIRNKIESTSNKIKQEEYMKELTEQLLDFLILVKAEVYSNWEQKKENIKCKKDLVTLINKSVSVATQSTNADFFSHCIAMIRNSFSQIINQECGKQAEQIDKLVDSILLQYFDTQLQNIFQARDSYEFFYSYMMEDAANQYESQKSM